MPLPFGGGGAPPSGGEGPPLREGGPTLRRSRASLPIGVGGSVSRGLASLALDLLSAAGRARHFGDGTRGFGFGVALSADSAHALVLAHWPGGRGRGGPPTKKKKKNFFKEQGRRLLC